MNYRIDETMSVCDQLVKATDRINALTIDMSAGVGPDAGDELLELYNGFRLDELEHAQVLLLKLTELLTQTAEETEDAHSDDADGSAFIEGELTDNIGDKTSEEDALDITLEPEETTEEDGDNIVYQILRDALAKVEKRKAAVPEEA